MVPEKIGSLVSQLARVELSLQREQRRCPTFGCAFVAQDFKSALPPTRAALGGSRLWSPHSECRGVPYCWAVIDSKLLQKPEVENTYVSKEESKS